MEDKLKEYRVTFTMGAVTLIVEAEDEDDAECVGFSLMETMKPGLDYEIEPLLADVEEVE